MMQKSFVCLALAVLSLLSCTSDAYDKGEGEYSLMRGDLAEGRADASCRLTGMTTDDGDNLAFTEPYSASWIARGDTIYRIMLYYNKPAEGTAEVLSLRRVPMLVPRPVAKLETDMKTDPLKLDAVWLSANRRYLNLRLSLLTGMPADDPDATQTVALVSYDVIANADGTTTLPLRLYHDQGQVPEYYTATSYASIALSGLDVDTVRLSVQTYDGELTRSFAVK